eukprot:TRINITY_DN3851_c0_g2_i1.p1 TRINITY_DN3851_c0_g2~~TRINITY_DN3851_c0_g2_i1.p1  ORF type:complete len:290 (+),score=47.15 TRINITY_DN3851_c0_g2_i1:50-871(+)
MVRRTKRQPQQPRAELAPPMTAGLVQLPGVASKGVQRSGSATPTSVGSEAPPMEMRIGSGELSSSASSDGSLQSPLSCFSIPPPPGLEPPWMWNFSAPELQSQPGLPPSMVSHQFSAPESLQAKFHEALLTGNVASLIKSYSHKSVAAVEELMALSEGVGYSLSIDDYNVLLHAYSQAGDVELSERCMEKLAEKHILPNLVTYNSVINACAVSGDPDRALTWLGQLQKAGFEPNNITYGTICKAFSRIGDAASIQAIICALEKRGVPPNEYYY